jgi:hypothetical protein
LIATRHNLRLLLDQGFPKPPGFDVRSIDGSLEVIHLNDFDRRLSTNSTPDWLVYWTAHQNSFDAVVTRDASQLSQILEMFVLSRLPGMAVITWRSSIEDPVTEWGQLIAYLPEIRKRLDNDASRSRNGTVILLPKPSLATSGIESARDRFGELVTEQGISNGEAVRDARSDLKTIIEGLGLNLDDFASLFGGRPNP